MLASWPRGCCPAPLVRRYSKKVWRAACVAKSHQAPRDNPEKPCGPLTSGRTAFPFSSHLNGMIESRRISLQARHQVSILHFTSACSGERERERVCTCACLQHSDTSSTCMCCSVTIQIFFHPPLPENQDMVPLLPSLRREGSTIAPHWASTPNFAPHSLSALGVQ